MSKNKKEEIKKNSDLKKIIILIAVILVVFAIFYVVTIILNKNNHADIFEKEKLGNTEIQYDEILVGAILNQSPKSYYVLVKEDDTYDKLISEYATYKYDEKIYTVDLTSAFNKNSKAEESSYEGDLKFKGTTLLKIEDGKIETVYEDTDEIEDKLNDLLETAKEKTTE